jgi:TPR repeat protein
LGNGVEKNFDTAYNYYKLAIENDQERGELPEPAEILLLNCKGDDIIERMVTQGVSVEWCEYAISRLEQPVSGIVYRAMANAYPWGGEKCLYWMQRAADTGDLTAKQIVETELIPTKINETLNSNDCLSEDDFMDEDFEDDDCDDEYIECRCCHHRFLRDEVEDPETDICNDCLYSGNEFAQD